MSILDLYGRGEPVISFEFFPPKTDAGFRSLFRNIEELKTLSPGFVSVTMGAGGSTRAKTVDLVIRIKRELGLATMAHLPCVGFEKHEIGDILDALVEGGVLSVLALGGDPPQGDAGFRPPIDGFRYANELAAYIKQHAGGFCVGGACYPEVHPSAPSAETDLANLVRKVEDGVDFLVSQLFFDNAKFFEFEERARAAGIDAPIVPGIMPITSVAGVRRMAELGGGSFPPELEAELARVENDEAATELGVRWGIDQCRELLDHGVPGLHFFTLNRSPATRRIHEALF